MSTLYRIDLRFSGSFAELDDGDVSGLADGADGVVFEFNDEQVLEDLADALGGLGLDASMTSVVDDPEAGFREPGGLDGAATSSSGWPRFGQGATATRFMRVEASASESLTMAIHDAFSMATVRLDWQDVVAYDEMPTVAVNVVQQVTDTVDPRSPHERRADGLVAAVTGGVADDAGD